MQYAAEESEEDVKRRRLASEPIDRRKTLGFSRAQEVDVRGIAFLCRDGIAPQVSIHE